MNFFIFYSRWLDHRNQYTDNIHCTQTLFLARFLDKLQTELNPLTHTTLHTVERPQASRLTSNTTRGITGTSYYDLISFQTLHHRYKTRGKVNYIIKVHFNAHISLEFKVYLINYSTISSKLQNLFVTC